LGAKRRRFTVHCLRHTWASIHLHSGTPVTWIAEQGGWAGSQVLLDTYGHPLRGETERFSDQLSVDDGPRRTHAADGG
jgi:integrase